MQEIKTLVDNTAALMDTYSTMPLEIKNHFELLLREIVKRESIIREMRNGN